ncbi:MAG: hypothetical protein ABSE46_13690 [Terracidiphilus sp.]
MSTVFLQSGSNLARWHIPFEGTTQIILAAKYGSSRDQEGLHFDIGKLRAGLDELGIANGFEIYSGTHTNAEASRFQNLAVPLFHKILFL